MVLKAFNLTRDMLDHSFAGMVAPDREKLLTCIQCGTCTASCPTAYAMDYTPRQLWRLIQIGLRDEALNSMTFWLCTSCYSCTIRCPRGIALTETMAALKRLAMAEGVQGKDVSARFYTAFRNAIRAHGRLHELGFMMAYSATRPAALVGRAPLGLALVRKGKLAIKPGGVKRKDHIEAIFRKVEELEAKK